MQGTTSTGEFGLVQQSKKFPGSLIGVKDSDFVGRPEAETPETGAVGGIQGYKKRSAKERTHIHFTRKYGSSSSSCIIF